MTNEEAIRTLETENDLILFDPMTGEEIEYPFLNPLNKAAYDAHIVAIAALRAQQMDSRARMADLLRLEEYQGLGPIAHLRELVQAERDGRLVVLPCKVGRLVWSMNNNGGVCSHQIRRFERNKDGDFACSALMFPLDDFGKTVFLTRDEAEAALEEQKGGGENDA